MNRSNATSARAALTGICLSFFMVILDTTVVNTAVAAIQEDLGASLAWLQWSVNAYTLVFASFLLSAGALGDRLGAKKVFVAGLALFTVASAACSCASSLPLLVGARIAQGIGAAALMPGSLSLIAHSFPSPRGRAQAIGLWGGMGGIAIASGPVVGGLLVDTFGWPSIFLINVPVGVTALLLTLRHVAPTPPSRTRALDPLGQVLAIVALGSFTYVLIEGPVCGWGALHILAMGLLTFASGGLFLAVEGRRRDAMLPLGLFRSRPFAAANVVGFCLNFGLYGLLFVLSLFFQGVCRFSALATGLAFLPLTAAIAVTLWQSSRIALRFGPRSPMIAGMALAAAGCLVLLGAAGTADYSGATVAGFLLLGLGIGMTMPAMTAVVLASAPREQSGIASGVLSASRQTGGAIGVALLGSLAASPGFQVDLTIAAAAFLLSCLVSCAWIGPDATNMPGIGKRAGAVLTACNGVE